jgi:hypothetical protein
LEAASLGRGMCIGIKKHAMNASLKDYFTEDSTFDAMKFHQRFRMRRELFHCLIDAVCTFDPWFIRKRDALGRLGLSSLQKCTTTLQMLAYGVPADVCDEYYRLGESTTLEAIKHWIIAIRDCFEAKYLRQPTRVELERQVRTNTDCGLPCMFASLNYIYWTWKNCPVTWQGQFQDKDKNRSVILEAIADESLWFSHAFFGLPGNNNDINVWILHL